MVAELLGETHSSQEQSKGWAKALNYPATNTNFGGSKQHCRGKKVCSALPMESLGIDWVGGAWGPR